VQNGNEQERRAERQRPLQSLRPAAHPPNAPQKQRNGAELDEDITKEPRPGRAAKDNRQAHDAEHGANEAWVRNAK
jgi:hypothetical protein